MRAIAPRGEEVRRFVTREYLFTSESVTEGHPDKICDQISDAVLDEIIRQETALEADGRGSVKDLRCACETFVTTGLVVVGGEIRTNGYVAVDELARNVIKEIGYTHSDYGFDATTCGVMSVIHGQSPDIAGGVDSADEIRGGVAADPYDQIGAGDQGMMFGFACNETSQFMPMPIYLAHRLSEKLTEVRKAGALQYLRPDGKTQVSVVYRDGKPIGVDRVLISTQHAKGVERDAHLTPDLTEHVIAPVFADEGLDFDPKRVTINPSGVFEIGGPMGDTGLTGRKIIVDTYGGMGRHGGGAFSGKDATKVDRSGAYAARWVAKNIVAAGLADRAEVQIAYAIGQARPFSLMVETFGTETVDLALIERAIAHETGIFDLRPGAIIDTLDLRKPIFQKTAAYGHFGRAENGFTWEQTTKVAELRAACGL